MSSIIKIATSLACLAAVALANPVNAGSSHLLSRRGESDCPAGTVYYVCANGYKGCYETDPCALPPIATTSLAAAPIPTPAAACASGAGSVWQPTMYNLSPSEPDKSQAAVTFLQVQAGGDSPQAEQVAVFRGVPAAAKACTLHWAQAAEAERTFVVDGSGYTSVLPLTGFPAAGAPVSSSSIAAFEPADDGKATHPDFTFWDKQSKNAVNHTAGAVDCAEDLYFKVSIDTLNGDGHVYLQQDSKNGLFITYTC
ncbi:hypothetical protein F4804DRAFT_328000 [Jackrogersella minutella]|nr:hypothetical protein F4804DRAFT_328000 [Jackrogersella minutella]